jgi:hypothetical protein
VFTAPQADSHRRHRSTNGDVNGVSLACDLRALMSLDDRKEEEEEFWERNGYEAKMRSFLAYMGAEIW